MKHPLDVVIRYTLAAAAALMLAYVIADNANAAEPKDYAQAGAFPVSTSEETWRDAMRERDVPVKIYAPGAGKASESALRPVILFSHGLGGSREAGTLWAAHWASHGYIVLAMQHAGSDEGLWKSRPAASVVASLKAGMTLTNLGLRVGDVRFVIDEIERRGKVGDALWKRADLKRIGMSGHSFGAQTTQAVSGQSAPTLAGQSGLDPRIAASIAFSPNARNKMNLDRQFGDIRIPFLSVTGTKDGSVLDDGTTWQDRLLPYEHMKEGAKYLLVLDGADHMVFGGQEIRRRARTDNDARVQQRVKAVSLAFWQAHLSADAEARDWLTADFKSTLGLHDQFRTK